METIYYTGTDGKSYSYQLDESKVLASIDTSNIGSGITNDFVKWSNPSFDANIYVGAGFGDGSFNGFDIRYQNTVNALSYIGNISKSQTKEDFDRWYGLYRETIYNQLVYESNILQKEIKRFEADYGSITENISLKIGEVVAAIKTITKVIELFKSAGNIVKLLNSLSSELVAVSFVVSILESIDSGVKMFEIPAREKALISQADKVQQLLTALDNEDFKKQINRFEEKLPKSLLSSSNEDFLSKYKYLIIALIILAIWYWYKNKN